MFVLKKFSVNFINKLTSNIEYQNFTKIKTSFNSVFNELFYYTGFDQNKNGSMQQI